VKPCIAVCKTKRQHYNHEKNDVSLQLDPEMLVTSQTDLERFVICPEADAWYILQPNWEATTKLHCNISQETGVLHVRDATFIFLGHWVGPKFGKINYYNGMPRN